MLDSREVICKSCENRGTAEWISVLYDLMDDNVKGNAALVKKHSGDMLIKSGERCEAVYFLLKGTAKIYKELPDGILYEIASVRAPCLMGETEAITDEEFSRGTVCTESDNAQLIYMPKEVFLHWLHSSNKALFSITRLIIYKNFSQQNKDRAMLFSHGYQRLAYRLLSYYEDMGGRGKVFLNIPRERLSEDTGLNIRSISRALNRLEEQGLITRQGRLIVVDGEQADKMKLSVYSELNEQKRQL